MKRKRACYTAVMFSADTWPELNRSYREWVEAHPNAIIVETSHAVLDNGFWSLYIKFSEHDNGHENEIQ